MSNSFYQGFLWRPIISAIVFLMVFFGVLYFLTFPALPTYLNESFEKRVGEAYQDREEIINFKIAIYSIKRWSDEYRVSLWMTKKGKAAYHKHLRYDYLWELRSGIYQEIENYLNKPTNP